LRPRFCDSLPFFLSPLRPADWPHTSSPLSSVGSLPSSHFLSFWYTASGHVHDGPLPGSLGLSLFCGGEFFLDTYPSPFCTIWPLSPSRLPTPPGFTLRPPPLFVVGVPFDSLGFYQPTRLPWMTLFVPFVLPSDYVISSVAYSPGSFDSCASLRWVHSPPSDFLRGPAVVAGGHDPFVSGAFSPPPRPTHAPRSLHFPFFKSVAPRRSFRLVVVSPPSYLALQGLKVFLSCGVFGLVVPETFSAGEYSPPGSPAFRLTPLSLPTDSAGV